MPFDAAHDQSHCRMRAPMHVLLHPGIQLLSGPQRLALYENTLAQLKDELRRATRRPTAVYFSPSSDLFQPVPAVLATAHDVLELLLGEGVGVSILTKGVIPQQTMALLEQHSGLVRIQVGVITIDEAIAAQFEPDVPTPGTRIEQMRQLAAAGVPVEARLDPILPGITDSSDGLRQLFDCAASAGVTMAAAGVLFLRPAIVSALRRAVPASVLSPLFGAYGTRDRVGLRGGSPALIDAPSRTVRADILGRVREAAAASGITVRTCACKNPDLASGTCNIAGTSPPRPPTVTPRQPELPNISRA